MLIPSFWYTKITLALVSLVLVIATVLCASAGAVGMAYGGGTRLVFKAGDGDANTLAVTQNGEFLRFTESSVPVQALQGCVPVSYYSAQCPVAGINNFSVVLGDGDDVVEFGPGITIPHYLINGGTGTDLITADSMQGQGNINGGGGEYDMISSGQGDDNIVARDVTVAANIHGGAGNDVIFTTGEELWLEYPNEAFPPGGGTVNGGPGDDIIDSTAMTGDAVIMLSDGDDVVFGGPGREYVRVDEGHEWVDGGAGDDYFLSQHMGLGSDTGDDYVYGGEGDDQMLIEDAPGYVTFDGGPGLDFVDYWRWNYLTGQGFNISFDNVANDGGLGEQGDNFFETVEGVGYHASNHWGPDTLVGSASDDVLRGHHGGDDITGAAGRDRLYGGPGGDVIRAADGEADLVQCGAQPDTAYVDLLDDVTAGDCETVIVQ